jgi:hypothetical protein
MHVLYKASSSLFIGSASEWVIQCVMNSCLNSMVVYGIRELTKEERLNQYIESLVEWLDTAEPVSPTVRFIQEDPEWKVKLKEFFESPKANRRLMHAILEQIIVTLLNS